MGALDPSNTTGHIGEAAQQDGCQSIHTVRMSSMDQWKNPKGMTDWLNGKNPLNATETLTEWLLVTLVDKLEDELRELRIKVGAVTDGLGKEEDIVDNC
jgi:potassium channel subfamily K